MGKFWLNNMATNMPAKMAPAMVVPAAAAAEMVVVGSRRRVWMWRRSQSLQRNDATNTLAMIKLLSMRWRKRGSRGGKSSSGGGSGNGTAVATWWQRQHGGSSSSSTAVAAWRCVIF